MALTDRLIENLRLKKSIFLLKTILIFIVVGALFLVAYTQYGSIKISISPYVGRVFINGFIGDDFERDSKIRKLKSDSQLKALIVHVNSPGGGVVGSESLYNALRDLSTTKHVVVVMGSLAASGGYMISLAADYIIASFGTITGSVGVIMQAPDLSKISDKLGFKMNIIKSGNLKGEPSMFESLSSHSKESLKKSLCFSFYFFRDLAMNRRGITDPEIIKEISTGKIFIGKEALDVSLIDKLGNEQDAISWLSAKLDAKIAKNIKNINLDSKKFQFLNKKSAVNNVIDAFMLDKFKSNGILAVLPGYTAN